jgi:peptidoglycan/LPS O-acetylase OafA/YrhL
MEPWWKFALFVVNLDIDYASNAAFSHAWSLCVEEHFYLLFPALALLLARKPSATKFWIACIVVLLGGIALRTGVVAAFRRVAAATRVVRRGHLLPDVEPPRWPADGRDAGDVAGLSAGIVGAHGEARERRSRCSGLAVLALAFWLFRERTGLLGNSIGWPVLSLALALLVFAGAQPHGFLGKRALPGAAWLAAISFSLYLVHKPMYGVVQSRLGRVARRARHRGVCGVRRGLAAGRGGVVLRSGAAGIAPADEISWA